MNYCKKCGNELNKDAKFCEKCGLQVSEKTREQKIVYEGKIHKCPSCGANVKAFEYKCSYCGNEFKNIDANSSLEKFSIELEKIVSKKLPRYKSKEDDDEYEDRIKEERDKEIANYISKYPIPNSKEDLIEFMILATNSIDVKSDSGDVVKKAWISKMNQILKKAEITFKGSKDWDLINDLYNKKISDIKNYKFQKVLLIVLGVSGWFTLLGMLGSPLISIAIFLVIVSLTFFIYGLIVGDLIELFNFKFRRKNLNIICILLIIIAMILGTKGIIDYHNSPEQQAIRDYYNADSLKYNVEIDIDFATNLLFNKYNVDLTIYDKTDTLYHGKDKKLNYQLPEGEHVLKFTGDGMIERVTLKVKGNTYVKYKLSCHEDEIKVKELDYSIIEE